MKKEKPKLEEHGKMMGNMFTAFELAEDILKAKVGETISFKLKDKRSIFKRIK